MCPSAESSQVSFAIDDFIRDKDASMWFCKLDNGLTVYQDDDRPGLEEPSSWLRLRQYCSENNVNIVEMSARFRSNQVLVGAGADGYFFRRAILGGIGLTRKEKPVSRHYFIMGVLKDGVLHVKKWQVPEFMVIEEEDRDPNNEDLVGVSLIVNQQNGKVQV